MPTTDFQTRRRLERMDSAELARYQLARLNQLLARILPANEFYASKLAGVRVPLTRLEQLCELPYTYKDQLVDRDLAGRMAVNQTYPNEQYVRLHRTSGTHGRPMVVVDTAEDWRWFTGTWQYVLDAADVTPADRAALAFSFGPFIGFWSAYHALADRGAMVIPCGGMSSLARLVLLRDAQATVLCCTPSYALHLAEVAAQNQLDLGSMHVSRLIVAGEPGGSIPEVRRRIESAFRARVIDHAGATEVGPWGYADPSGEGLYVAESEFIAEFRTIDTDQPAAEGELSELVLTTLGRCGCPVIRYRTGDLGRPSWNHPGDNRFVFLRGGVLGRADDMLIIRGVNVFPSSIEQILRQFREVTEYRVTVYTAGQMDSLLIEVEDGLNDPDRIARQLKVRLGLTVQVNTVPAGSLPRFEGKGKRVVDRR